MMAVKYYTVGLQVKIGKERIREGKFKIENGL